MSSGAVYIITQDQRYVNLLLSSAASLKRAMPELPITVFSQFPVSNEHFERVVPVEPTGDGFYDKTKLIRQMPYDRTLFIDADTYIVEPVPELFSVLDQFDCAAAHEEYCNTDWSNNYPRPDIPACYPEFNTGIMALKRSGKMDRFLENWGQLYRSFLAEKPGRQINDQPFFRAAAYASDLRIATLTREYNCKFRGQGYLNGPVKIIHGHVKFQLTAEQANQAISVLNASTKPRVYIAGQVYEQKLVGRLVSRRTAHKVGSFPELPGSIMLMRARRLKEIIKERGIRKTLARAPSPNEAMNK
jgi:hypothetical protein